LKEGVKTLMAESLNILSVIIVVIAMTMWWN
jgi:hypothetical protein